MKGLVISGGGADGPHTLGVLDALGRPKYDYANGVSTGALIVLMYQMDKFDELYSSYLVDNNGIYNINLLNKKGKFSFKKILFHSIISIIKGRNSVGQHNNLKKIIDDKINKELFNEALSKNISANVGVHFDDSASIEWIGINAGFEEYKQAVFSSTAVPIIMTATTLYGRDTSDGGISEGVGIAEAVLQGCTEIDVFMHSPKSKRMYDMIKRMELLTGDEAKYIAPEESKYNTKAKNIFSKILNVLRGVYDDSDVSSLILGLSLAKIKGVKVNIYWMKREYYSNAFNFSPKKTENLYKIGKLYAKTLKETYDYGR